MINQDILNKYNYIVNNFSEVFNNSLFIKFYIYSFIFKFISDNKSIMI